MPSPSATPLRAGTSAVVTTVATVCPVFLVGGLSVQIGEDLHFSPAGLGLAVALYFTASSLASFHSGQLVERLGSRTVGMAATALSSLCLLAIAGLARNYPSLVVILTLAGPANSLGQLSSNALLARKVPIHRQGVMFGLKQAAVPLSTTLAGLLVPIVALTIGWRWGFVVAAALALTAWPLLPPPEPAPPRAAPRSRRPGRALVVITIAAALGATAANPLGSFITDFAVTRGMTEQAAGLTLTLGGLAGLVSRVGVGGLADRRRGGQLTMITVMLAAGALGLAGLAVAPALWLIPIGTVIGFALGWAWPGLLNFAITLRHADAPAAATGVTQTGVYLGGALGPLSFGGLVDLWGYPTAWATMAVLMLAGAVVMMVGRRMMPTDP